MGWPGPLTWRQFLSWRAWMAVSADPGEEEALAAALGGKEAGSAKASPKLEKEQQERLKAQSSKSAWRAFFAASQLPGVKAK